MRKARPQTFAAGWSVLHSHRQAASSSPSSPRPAERRPLLHRPPDEAAGALPHRRTATPRRRRCTDAAAGRTAMIPIGNMARQSACWSAVKLHSGSHPRPHPRRAGPSCLRCPWRRRWPASRLKAGRRCVELRRGPSSTRPRRSFTWTRVRSGTLALLLVLRLRSARRRPRLSPALRRVPFATSAGRPSPTLGPPAVPSVIVAPAAPSAAPPAASVLLPGPLPLRALLRGGRPRHTPANPGAASSTLPLPEALGLRVLRLKRRPQRPTIFCVHARKSCCALSMQRTRSFCLEKRCWSSGRRNFCLEKRCWSSGSGGWKTRSED
mmetsp:Transcript_27707/g.69557  ORF Transcript_27707/g.69557 Transcript_27707/m.69557 type:complete len:323 (+) Transcript_27707:258-1226(+)